MLFNLSRESGFFGFFVDYVNPFDSLKKALSAQNRRLSAVPRPAPGLDSRLWPILPALGAEPNPGVVADEWILSQVVFDEEVEPPLPAAVLQVEDGSPLDEASRGCSILVPYMGSV